MNSPAPTSPSPPKTSDKRPPASGIGVYISPSAIDAIAIERGAIRAHEHVHIPPDVTLDSNEYPEILRNLVSRLTRGLNRLPIWATASFNSLQVRYFSLPQTRGKSLSDLVYWTFQKDMAFDPGNTLFDYSIEGKSAESGLAPKLMVSAYTVANTEVETITGIFNQAGLKLHGLVVPPFILRNLFSSGWIPKPGHQLALYTGDQASVIISLQNGQVMINRLFKTGMNAIDPATTAPGLENPFQPSGFTNNPAMDRLIQQIERTISAHRSAHKDEPIQALWVAGELSTRPALTGAIQSQLGIHVKSVDLPGITPSPENGAPSADPVPGGYSLALGAALSQPGRTANLLHTRAQQDTMSRRTRRDALLACLLLFLAAAILGAAWFLNHENNQFKAQVEAREVKLNSFVPRVDGPILDSAILDLTRQSRNVKTMARFLAPLAALNLTAEQTPETIRLNEFRLLLPRPAPVAPGRRASTAARNRTAELPTLTLTGIVGGPPGMQRSVLASYVLDLQSQPLVESVTVQQSETASDGFETLLRFTTEIKLAYGGPPTAPPANPAAPGAPFVPPPPGAQP
ncbi:MAG TPA: hypothetical protein PKE55_10185 [Kiritimatiellia bacterium]|nr:hypothetical protein [Kiritimatiellia bacterium]